MDADVTLKTIRGHVKEILRGIDGNDECDWEELEESGAQLARQVKALDDHLRRGGTLPHAWRRASKAGGYG
jgi:hypothetical protein